VIGVRVADGAEIPISSQRWEGENFGRVAWLADGSGLIVTVPDQQGGGPQIWQLSYPKDEARQIINDLNGYTDLSLTTDSGTLAAVRTDRLLNIWVAPSEDVSRAKQITSGAERDDGRNGLDWTPEGKIVYRSMAGGNPNIWIMAADGTGNKQLSVNARNNVFPSVSPDGRYLVWVANHIGTGVDHIWRMDIDGGNPKQLTRVSGVWFPQYSPDGKWVVYESIRPEIDYHSLWKLPLDGGDPVQLTKKEQPSWVPVVSPDGKLIACNRLDQASGQWKIAVIPFEGEQPTKIFDLPGPYTRQLRWTPDGRAVAFIRTSGGVSNLWGQPIDGGPPRQLTVFKEQRILNFAWSRDGKQLALSRGMVNSDVVLISGFR
jgi:Tol biopolymer transport system component